MYLLSYFPINQLNCNLISMQIEKKYNSVCLEQKCFRARNAFFQFEADSIHIAEDHEIVSITPTSFVKMFREQLSNSSQVAYQFDKPFALVKDCVDRAAQEIFFYVHDHLFGHILQKAQQLKEMGQLLTITKFTSAMAEGNYELLETYNQFKRSGSKDFLSKRLGYIEALIARTQGEVDRVKGAFMAWANSYVPSTANPADQIAAEKAPVLVNRSGQNQGSSLSRIPNNEPIRSLQNNPQFNEVPRVAEVRLKTEEGLRNIKEEYDQEVNDTYIFWQRQAEQKRTTNNQEYSIEDDEEIQESEQQQKHRSAELGKTKLIEKAQKDKSGYQLKKRKRRPIFQRIYEIRRGEVAIKEVYTIKRTFKTLTQTYSNTSKLHIFDRAFISISSVDQLCALFPNLEVLTVNCYIDAQILQSFPIQILKKLKRLCLKWDMEQFLQQYLVGEYFQKHRRINYNHQKKEKLSLNLQKIVQSNEHYQLSAENEPSSNFYNIRSLQTKLSLLMKNNASLQGVFPRLKHLKVTKDILYAFTNQEIEAFLSRLLSKCKELRSIYLENFDFNKTPLDKELSHSYFCSVIKEITLLPVLLHLSLLFSNSKEILLSAASIKCFKNLESLNIKNARFLMETQQQRTQTSSILAQFGNLRTLSLYQCSDITSDCLNQIQGRSLQLLQFLNLGATKVDDKCLQTICKMKWLHSLNIEQTAIRGKSFVAMLKRHYDIFQEKHQLIRLNIKTKSYCWKRQLLQTIRRHSLFQGDDPEKQNKIKKEAQQARISLSLYDQLFSPLDLEQMATLMPKLEYLNVCNHYHLSDVNYSKFESLKVLALNFRVENKQKISEKIRIFQE